MIKTKRIHIAKQVNHSLKNKILIQKYFIGRKWPNNLLKKRINPTSFIHVQDMANLLFL